METEAILTFWFDELTPRDWFAGGERVDRMVTERFKAVYEEMSRPEADFASCLATPEGSLALILILDQFPRNLFRDDLRAFATDARGRVMAEAAIGRGHDLETPVERRVFFYLPFEHSESLADQDRAIELIRERADVGDYLEWAERHRAVIARFGRFPHRNEILGRDSTADEKAYLEDGGERFSAADTK